MLSVFAERYDSSGSEHMFLHPCCQVHFTRADASKGTLAGGATCISLDNQQQPATAGAIGCLGFVLALCIECDFDFDLAFDFDAFGAQDPTSNLVTADSGVRFQAPLPDMLRQL